jgi:hypothetical protein
MVVLPLAAIAPAILGTQPEGSGQVCECAYVCLCARKVHSGKEVARCVGVFVC